MKQVSETFSVTLPQEKKVLVLGSNDVLPFEPRRLNERVVRSDSKDGPAYAIEASIPLTDALRKHLAEKIKFRIPRNITSLTYLDLAPQHSVFPIDLRTVRTSEDSMDESDPYYLYRLRKISSGKTMTAEAIKKREIQKADVLADLIGGVFHYDSTAKKSFTNLLAQATGTDLLVVFGHGGGNPHRMGEISGDPVQKDGHVLQREGNEFSTEEIIARYNHPEIYAGIILHACNFEKANIQAKKVALAYLEGLSNEGPFQDIGKPIVKKPQTEIDYAKYLIGRFFPDMEKVRELLDRRRRRNNPDAA